MKNDINIFDIARIAGVGKSTVSRVINGHAGVSEETRLRVLQAIEQNTYIPNNSARNLSSHSTNTVVLLVYGITNPFFAPIISHILETMQNRNYAVLLHSYEYGSATSMVDAAVSICKEKRPKGLMLLGGNFEEKQDLLRQIDIPIVTISTKIHDSDTSWFSSVTIDDKQEGQKIAEYICAGNHRKIALIGQHGLREEGMNKVFKQHGITPATVELDFSKTYSYSVGYNAASKLFKQGQYTCLICLSDVLAIGALKAAIDAGLDVPNDISIIGFDGLETAGYTNPSLTTFVQPAKELASKCVSLMLDVLDEGKGHKHLTLTTTLAPGGSFRNIRRAKIC